jgi:branched-subunit amino acid transport protein
VNALAVFAIAAVGSYALRVSMLVLLGGRPLPRTLVTPVGLVGPAAVGALTIGALVRRGHVAGLPTIVASIVSFAVVRRTGRLTYGLLAGFPVVWLLNAAALL